MENYRKLPNLNAKRMCRRLKPDALTAHQEKELSIPIDFVFDLLYV